MSDILNVMEEQLQHIIHASTFGIEPGIWVYAKVRSVPTGKHFLVAQDNDEITVVTTDGRLDELDLIERNKDDYVLIRIDISIPFYAVGFLAAVTSAIAEKQANVLVVSTYSRDYVLVSTEHQEMARQAMLELGFQETELDKTQ